MARNKRRKTSSSKVFSSMKAVTAFLAVAAVIFVGAAVYYGINGQTSDEDTVTVLVYFLNTRELTWEPEARKIPLGTERDMLAAAVREWLAGPKSDQLSPAAPAPQPFEEVKLDGGVVEVTYYESFNDLPPEQAVICNASLVYTLTSLNFVNDVRVFVGDMALLKDNGAPVGALTRSTVVVSGAGVAGEENATRGFTVYFADAEGAFLVPVKREVAVDPNLPIEKYIIEQIIKGPSEDWLYAVISPDVKLNSVKTEDGGRCYVDFSDDFVKKFDGGSAAEAMLIYSIVDSLTELTSVKEVQFFVNGEVILEQPGFEIDLSKPIPRNEAIIEK